MPKFICIPVYDRPNDSELDDILADLNRQGFAHTAYVAELDELPAKAESKHGLTPGSLELFKALVEDAPNWSGTPLITVTPAERGYLTHLKKLGLLTTFVEEDGCSFAAFTDAGKALAAELELEGAASLAW